MRVLRRSLVLWACLLLAQHATYAGVQRRLPLPELLPISEVEAGMSGYGLSALSGEEVHKFTFKVLGVLKGWGPRSSIILIEMAGDVIDRAGVIAGMSGSPVYIDGKLLGAVAYGWPYSKIALAGVTPAEEMFAVEKIDRQAAQVVGAAAKTQFRTALRERFRELSEALVSRRRGQMGFKEQQGILLKAIAPVRVGPTWPALRAADVPEQLHPVLPPSLAARMQPLPLPLSIAGSGPVSELLSAVWEGTSFVPLQVSAGGAASADAPELAPGTPVGAAFITGDMDMAAMGTTTAVIGDRVLAFGHSMFGTGSADLPLAVGRTQAVVPSVYRSFRLTSTEKIIGRVTQDREAAIVGRIGEDAPMFPCVVRVKGVVDEEYNYQIAGYWQIAPMLALIAVEASVLRFEGSDNFYTLEGRSKIFIKGREEPLSLGNVSVSTYPAMPAFDMVFVPLATLLSNDFEEVEIDRMELDVEVRDGFDLAWIESVRVDRLEVAPGENIVMWVKLKKFRGEELEKRIALQVPENAQPGTQAQILVCDARTSLSKRLSMDPGFGSPRDLEDLIQIVEMSERNTSLIARGSFLTRGLRFQGTAMPDLPPSVLTMLSFNRQFGETHPLTMDVSTKVEMPWIISGSMSVRIQVREPEPGTVSPGS